MNLCIWLACQVENKEPQIKYNIYVKMDEIESFVSKWRLFTFHLVFGLSHLSYQKTISKWRAAFSISADIQPNSLFPDDYVWTQCKNEQKLSTRGQKFHNPQTLMFYQYSPPSYKERKVSFNQKVIEFYQNVRSDMIVGYVLAVTFKT